MVRSSFFSLRLPFVHIPPREPDPSLKLFAQKYMYHRVDVIAVRDLGFSVSRSSSSAQQQTARTETSFATSNVSNNTASISSQPFGHKHAPSPDHRKGRDNGSGRGGNYGPGSKRQHSISPLPKDRDRDGGSGRDRRDRPPRRRHSPPPDREIRGRDRDYKDDKPLLPHVIPWFLGQLPAPSHFDGKLRNPAVAGCSDAQLCNKALCSVLTIWLLCFGTP